MQVNAEATSPTEEDQMAQLITMLEEIQLNLRCWKWKTNIAALGNMVGLLSRFDGTKCILLTQLNIAIVIFCMELCGSSIFWKSSMFAPNPLRLSAELEGTEDALEPEPVEPEAPVGRSVA